MQKQVNGSLTAFDAPVPNSARLAEQYMMGVDLTLLRYVNAKSLEACIYKSYLLYIDRKRYQVSNSY